MLNPNQAGLTSKQYKILLVICDGNGKDEAGAFLPIDLDELIDRLSYRTSKQSMQFSIRALMKHNMITKDWGLRRGARRVIYTPTRTCRQIMGYHDPSFIEEADLSYLDV